MQLLAAHPNVVAGTRYPLETYAAKWWLHQAKVGSDPADFRGSIRPNDVADDPLHVGTPVHHLMHDPAAFEWMATRGVERAAAFALESIDEFYETYATVAGKVGVRYFAEKRFGGPSRPDLGAELYPQRRELLLVRDLRDVFASRVAFHTKNRGTAPMAADPATAGRHAIGMRRHFEWIGRRTAEAPDTTLVVRYEDLVGDPRAVMASVTEFLGVEHPTDAVLAAIDDAVVHSGHVTSGSPEASVGRWERDLAPEIVAAVRAQIDEANAAMGYR